MTARRYNTFADFYPFYLTEHQDPTCRRLHFIGTSLVLAMVIASVISGRYWMLALTPLCGYGFAWVGHFVFEKNRPASFSQPLYSFVSDFVMFKDILTGRIDQKLEEARQIVGLKDAEQSDGEATATG